MRSRPRASVAGASDLHSTFERGILVERDEWLAIASDEGGSRRSQAAWQRVRGYLPGARIGSEEDQKLVVTGLVTHGCVRATCLGAQKLGYPVVLVKDGYSNYHKQAAELIEEWNRKLSRGNVELRATAEIDFS